MDQLGHDEKLAILRLVGKVSKAQSITDRFDRFIRLMEAKNQNGELDLSQITEYREGIEGCVLFRLLYQLGLYRHLLTAEEFEQVCDLMSESMKVIQEHEGDKGFPVRSCLDASIDMLVELEDEQLKWMNQ